jgi:hypothetical protein
LKTEAIMSILMRREDDREPRKIAFAAGIIRGQFCGVRRVSVPFRFINVHSEVVSEQGLFFEVPDIDEPPPAPEIADAATPPIEPAIPRASPVEGDVGGEEYARLFPSDLEQLRDHALRAQHGEEAVAELSDLETAVAIAGGAMRGAGPEPSAIAPPTALEIAPAAAARSVEDPGIDGVTWLTYGENLEAKLTDLHERMLDPALAPQPPWIGKLSFVFSLTAVIGFGAAALTLPNLVRNPAGGIAAAEPPLNLYPSEPAGGIAAAEPPLNLYPSEPPIQPARLVVESQHGFVNEAVPLGISLADASGGESLTVLGLVAGTRLSTGTPLGATVWQLSARELGSALAYAPNDFVGVMHAIIDLRSASGQPIDVQVIRLEWIRKEEERFTPQLDPSKSLSAIQLLDLEEEEIAFLIKRGEDFLTVGDIASAQILLKRAANAGSPQAALKVGMTFDPIFLAQNGVVGLAPDVALAREWYKKAMKLGSTEALRHLELLGDKGK